MEQMSTVRTLLSPLLTTLISVAACTILCYGCASTEEPDEALSSNVRCELVDWHPANAFGIIRCPIAWIRVTNYNNVPIKHVKVQYLTYDVQGNLLNQDVYELEGGTVEPSQVKNYFEQYLGLVNTHSERLGIKLESVDRGP
jgi:hypothetical protein